MHSWKNQLKQVCPEIKFVENEPLSQHTTVGIGGKAELFCIVTKRKELSAVLKAGLKLSIPITLLGWGANTLIADRGISGLVIKNATNKLRFTALRKKRTANKIADRWQAATSDKGRPQFQNIDYDEGNAEYIGVEIDSGAALPIIIQKLVQQGVTGLQWFAKIPATIGGAVVNNVHGGTHYICEYIESVLVLTPAGKEKVLANNQLEFNYDYSRFHHSGEYILAVRLLLPQGDQQKAQQVITEWSRQKQAQPPRSLGCIFQNLSQRQQKKLSLPTPSIGYIVNKQLRLSGTREGDAEISRQHGAFIINHGHATASEYLSLIRLIHQKVWEKYGIKLKPEIFFKGFTSEELLFLTD